MKASAVVNALNIADSTVRKYADLYAEFLSPSGVGGAGRHRDYTEHDLRVLKLIRDMKYEHVSNEDIDATLRSLQVGGWDRLPALNDNTKAIIPAPGAAIAAQSNREALVREIEIWREMAEKAAADRDELLGKLHRAETMLELYESGRLKPPAKE